MTYTIVEWATIKLRSDKTEAEFLAASDLFQSDFVNHQKGFIRRELIRTGDGEYADFVHWQTIDDANAIMELVESSAACRAFFSFMDMENVDPTTGVAHYISLATYASANSKT